MAPSQFEGDAGACHPLILSPVFYILKRKEDSQAHTFLNISEITKIEVK